MYEWRVSKSCERLLQSLVTQIVFVTLKGVVKPDCQRLWSHKPEFISPSIIHCGFDSQLTTLQKTTTTIPNERKNSSYNRK